jgi:hypothetical protein
MEYVIEMKASDGSGGGFWRKPEENSLLRALLWEAGYLATSRARNGGLSRREEEKYETLKDEMGGALKGWWRENIEAGVIWIVTEEIEDEPFDLKFMKTADESVLVWFPDDETPESMSFEDFVDTFSNLRNAMMLFNPSCGAHGFDEDFESWAMSVFERYESNEVEDFQIEEDDEEEEEIFYAC